MIFYIFLIILLFTSCSKSLLKNYSKINNDLNNKKTDLIQNITTEQALNKEDPSYIFLYIILLILLLTASSLLPKIITLFKKNTNKSV